MRRQLFALAGGLLFLCNAQAQIDYYPNYLIYRVNLDAITGATTTLPGGAGGESGFFPGGPGSGAMPLPPISSGGPGRESFGGPGVGSEGNPTPTDNIPDVDLTKSIVAIIPLKKLVIKPVYPNFKPNDSDNPAWPAAPSKYGKIYYYKRGNFIAASTLPQRNNPETRVRELARAWKQSDNQNEGIKLITLALSTNQVEFAYQYAEEFAQYIEKNADKALPVSTQFVKAYRTMLPKLQTPGQANPEAAIWRKNLAAREVDTSTHFALVNWGDIRVTKKGIQDRLNLLEENMRGFYLWQALDGKAVPVPTTKLVVILAEDANDLPKLRNAMDGSPIIADAFHSPTHNVVVLSPERRDTVGRSFSAYLKSRYKQGWNREELLKGNSPPLSEQRNGMDVIEMTTLSCIDAAVQDQATRAMITSNGTRQLYAAAGLLPPHVHLSEWMESGTARLLEQSDTPYIDPLPNKAATLAVGVGVGYGSPHYRLIREYAKLAQQGELNPNPADLLRNTVMDNYFAAARDELDIDPTPAPKAGKAGISSTGQGPGTTNPLGSGANSAFPSAGGGRESSPFGGSPFGGSPFGGGPMSSGYAPGEGGMESGFGTSGGQQLPTNEPDPETLKRMKNAQLVTKSEVTAWGLVYFLRKAHLDELEKFHTALSHMPRDMYLDRTEVLKTFCRSMGLMQADKPNEIDENRFNQFAEQWVKFLNATPKSGYETRIEVIAEASANPTAGQESEFGGTP